MSRRVDLDVDRHDDHLLVRWQTTRASGEVRFDRVAGTVPEWIAAADDVLAGADRRSEDAVLDAIAAWADDAGERIGVWHNDGGIEILGG